MKTDINDPWCIRGIVVEHLEESGNDNCFEDSFVQQQFSHKLADSEQYLEKLYSRLNSLKSGSTKKDLVKSLSVVKEECIAHLITSDCNIELEEEAELASNPLLRHIVPHLQALTASELVHLLKADVLQAVTETIQEETSIENRTDHSELKQEAPDKNK